MKKLFVFAIAFIAFTGFSFPGNDVKTAATVGEKISSNTQEMFSYFRSHRQAKNVVLNWGITTPAGVSGFTIERSYDNEYFDVMNQVSCNNSTKFSWKDESVFPGYIYYRIGCMMSDGTCHYSATEVVRIVAH